MCFNSLLFADDLVLISQSISHIQALINICCTELNECDLVINCNKTSCIRIGPRHNETGAKLYLDDTQLSWKKEMRYLGVFIFSSRYCSISLQPPKQKFYRATNGILGKIVNTKNPSVILSLFNSFCVPVLLYGLEAFNLNKSCRNSLDFAFHSLFAKIFKTNDANTISTCQYYCGYLPASQLLDLKIINFFNGIAAMPNSVACDISIYLLNQMI